MSEVYSNNSITALKGPDQVRKRPAVIFGTNDAQGALHAVMEIIYNAVDEHREGFGNVIEISVIGDEIVVRDYGRGVPMDWNEKEGKYNWELVFATLYASGKYEDDNYKSALGLNGLGATATQFASEYFEVKSVRDGYIYFIRFEKGLPVLDLQKFKNNTNEPSGTTIRFKLDKEVFIDTNFDLYTFIDKLRRIAMLHKNLILKVYIDKSSLRMQFDLHFKNGVKDYLEEVYTRDELLMPIKMYIGSSFGSDADYLEPYRLDMEFAFSFAKNSGGYIELYHNGAHMSDGGSSYDAMRNAFVDLFNEIYNLDEKITFKDLGDYIVFIGITNCPGNRTFFKNQTKTAINNPFIKTAFQEFVYMNLKRAYNENKRVFDEIVEYIVENKKILKKVQEIKQKMKQKDIDKGVDKVLNRPKNFIDCVSKDIRKRELYIVEGESAKGSVKLARIADYQAIFAIRGKIINALKESLDNILNSDIVLDLIKVLGCGIEVDKENKYFKDIAKFDINKLAWDKIIICTDADIDGKQIRCILLALFYRLMPTLLREGKVYIVETPLYEIEVGKERFFAYSDEERDSIVKKFKGRNIKINRNKGLGENDPEFLNLTAMNPESRKLIQVTLEETEDEKEIMEDILGMNIKSRKVWIKNYLDLLQDIDLVK